MWRQKIRRYDHSKAKEQVEQASSWAGELQRQYSGNNRVSMWNSKIKRALSCISELWITWWLFQRLEVKGLTPFNYYQRCVCVYVCSVFIPPGKKDTIILVFFQKISFKVFKGERKSKQHVHFTSIGILLASAVLVSLPNWLAIYFIKPAHFIWLLSELQFSLLYF